MQLSDLKQTYWRVALLTVLVGAVTPNSALHAREAKLIAIAAIDEAAETERELTEFMGQSTVLALVRSGFEAVLLGTGSDLESRIDELDSSDVDRDAQLIEMAREAEADHLLLLTYTRRNETLDLRAAVEPVTAASEPSQEALAEIEERVRIDFELDRTLERIAVDTVTSAGLTPADVEQVDVERVDVEESGDPSATELPSAPLRDGPAAVRPPTVVGDEPDYEPYFEVSAGFGPFLPIGTMAQYTSIGYSPLATFRRAWFLGSFELSVGVLVGGQTMDISGLVTDASLWFVPIGGGVWLSSATDGPIVPQLLVASGATITHVAPSSGEPRQQLLPFALGGVGGLVPFSDAMGTAVHAKTTFVLDEAFAVGGFVPTVSIYYRF